MTPTEPGPLAAPEGSPRRPASPQAGFSLVELAIVLAILGIVLGMSADFAANYMDSQRRKETQIKLDTIEEALVLYAAQHRRLPCPADGTLPLDDEDAGTAQPAAPGACADSQQNGVVPWRDLGLPLDTAIDAWNTMFLYRVADSDSGTTCPGDSTTAPTGAEGMLLRSCGATNIGNRLAGVGLAVAINAAPGADDWLARPADRTGAAYVLISHGPNREGGITPDGNPFADVPTGDEVQNRNVQNVRGSTDPYVDTFDDILRFATVAQVAVKAKLR